MQTSATTGALRDNMLYLYDSYSASPEWSSHSFQPVAGVVAQSDILAVPRGMKTHERVYEVYDKSSTAAARSSQRTFYYDMRGRIVQSVETSPMGRTVRVSCKYDYTGNPLIRHEQYTIGGTTTVVVYTYAYDSRGRVTAETTAVDGEQITDITYSYDELGQLKTVKAGSDIETSYTYNIQGWLTKKSTDKSILKPRLASINSGLIIDRDSLIMPPGDIIQPLQTNIFTQTLEYFSPKHAQPRYAGNIAETSWKRGSNAEADTYAYTYDRLGRLVDGRFISGGLLLTKQYGERNITYDKNTNILSLTRYNGPMTGTLYQYTYDGNRKQTLTSGTSTQTAASYGYQYDIMGNISKIGAENLLISYNYLNLPKIITKTGTPRSSDGATYVVGVTRPTASYIYLADGTKVQAIGETGQGYEYVGSLRLSVNGSSAEVESIPFAGGRIVKTSNGYEPQYYITDHLGSTRTVVKPNATVVAEFDYMPYGTQHAVAGAPITEADYKYTGKEQQTAFGLDNLYDSQARFQYVTDGSFMSHDDLAGKFPWLSPYNYCAGNPIMFVDPTGKIWRNAQGEAYTDEELKHIKVYIYYVKDFVQQAFVQYREAEKKYGSNAVAMSRAISVESFKTDWANMNGNIEAVLIMTHGKNQSIKMDDEDQITSTGDGTTNIYNDEAFNVQDLESPAGDISNATLFMYSCHSADDKMSAHKNQGALKGSKKPIAQVFSEEFNFKVVQGTKGAVNYYNYFWAFLNNFVGFGQRPFIYLKPYPENRKWVYYKK